MTENLEAAELRAQLAECQRIISAQADTIAEGRRLLGACESHNEMVLGRLKAANGAQPVEPVKGPSDEGIISAVEAYGKACAGLITVTEQQMRLHDIRALLASYRNAAQPNVPDGWKLVPIKPTGTMVVSGFESRPDPHFSGPEEWQRYDAMTGCQQAAYCAEKCWEAMLTAAPTPLADEPAQQEQVNAKHN